MAVKPQPRPEPVNVTIRDRIIAHGIQLERLKNGEAARIVGYLDSDVIPDLQAQLEGRLKLIEGRGIDAGPDTTKRLRAMIEALTDIIDVWTGSVASELAELSLNVAVSEAAWTGQALTTALPAQVATIIGFETIIPAVAQLRAAVVASPIDGVLLKDIVERMGRRTKEALEAEIRKGLVTGETTPQIVARARKVTDLTRNSANAIVRTAVGNASDTARQQTYSANSEIIKSRQLVETLDTRTCPQCMALDGSVHPVDSGPKPPHHISCRGSSAPVLRSWKELGILLKDLEPATRASMDGQVPAKTTYAEWIKRQSAEVQDDALGPARGALLRSGKFEVGDFVSRTGETITLNDLAKR